MVDVLLGIDIGTSGIKMAFFRPDGSVVASRRQKVSLYAPGPGLARQDPDEWWHLICQSLKEMVTADFLSMYRIRGIGAAGQGWSMIPVDASGKVLCMNPIWMDTGAADIAAEYEAKIGKDKIFRLCGNPMDGAYTLPKVIKLRREEPALFEKTAAVLSANGFIAFRLTGVLSQDISQAYGYQCFDIRKGCWDEEMCRQFDLPMHVLPPICSCDAIIGTVTAEAAAATGLPEGIPVAAGGLDAACGTLGAGVIADGETQEQGGQAEGMSICLPSCLAHPRLILSCHVVPGKWLLQGGTVGGGGVTDWLLDAFCGREMAEKGGMPYEDLDRLTESVAPGSEGVLFLPYMKGERSPLWNKSAKGVFYGLDFTKTRAHMIRAGLEGVGYSLRHNLETAAAAGAEVSQLLAVGGSTASSVITQMKADITGKRICVPGTAMETGLGAAILAGVGTGLYDSYEKAREMTLHLTRIYEPDPAKREVYNRGYKKYLRLYEELKDMMSEEENEA